MLYTVITTSRSRALSSGLTYEGPDGLVPGTHVKVPLRNQIVEGIISDVLEKRDQETFDLKSIVSVLSGPGLIPEAQLKVIPKIAEQYYCTLRQAAGLFLPPLPWGATLEKKEEVKELKDAIRGSLPSLSDEQQVAFDAIRSAKQPSLFFGVTGSGKTEIYIRLIAETIKAGKQAIVLCPEIFLAEHLQPRFEQYFSKDRMAIVHSKKSLKVEREMWRRIRRNEISIVLGARSALFSPLPNIGLIIIDEEHEWTYKSEQTPRYHARDVAEWLCTANDAKLVLGSATPSVESWAKAKNGQYHLVELKERYNGGAMPQVQVIDLATAEFGKHYPFTNPLIDAVQARLDRKEQSVLFLNHRGRASAMLCLQCRRRIVSPESQLPFTVHYGKDGKPFLLDHSSGMTAPVPDACPHCSSVDLREVGAGTQRIEESLKALFPKARILRADSDSLSSLDDMQKVLTTMADGKADILIGTQTVTKGLDLPSVTLAAVLVADIGMSLPHFRAGERTFQLLMQLTGRSGRHAPGEVIIQTFRPDAPEVQAAANHDAAKYLDTELKMRLAMGYPPAVPMTRLLTRGSEARKTAQRLKQDLEQAADAQKTEATITAGPTFFSGGKEWHILMRSNSNRALLQAIKLDGAIVDVEPLETL